MTAHRFARDFLHAVALTLFACLLATGASAQSNARVSGSLDYGGGVTTFQCTGAPTCNGTFNDIYHPSECSTTLVVTAAITITGLSLSQPGPIQGNATLVNWDYTYQINMDGTCSIVPGSYVNLSGPFSGTWDGRTGHVNLSYAGLSLPVTFTADLAPVFPMTVTASIDPVQATAGAQIQFRPQDVGTQGSVFVFALAPATEVKNATLVKRAFLGMMARGAPEDAPVQCVLAQLDSTGHLTAVSADSMGAFLTGVLQAGTVPVSILNSVPTPNVAGATFFVGYGANSSAMINNGVNQSAVTVPASVTCEPQPPQTGWWWNPAEDGRGFSIERQGHSIFYAAFLYDISGRSTWVVSSGPASLDGSYFVGDLYSANHGQTLGGAYPGFPATNKEGTLTLAFSDASHGTMIWPGGTVPIQRQPFVPNGLSLAPSANQPEAGWWWNPAENGRGFFLEWQGPSLDMAGYMYDDAGNPVWYITVDQMRGASGQTYSNTWWSYGGGQTLTGAWRPNHQTSNNVAPVTVQFTGPDSAILTLPNGRTTNLTRQRF
jgi:hypothetical protein